MKLLCTECLVKLSFTVTPLLNISTIKGLQFLMLCLEGQISSFLHRYASTYINVLVKWQGIYNFAYIFQAIYAAQMLAIW